MSLEKEKAKESAVHACGGACDGGQERDAVINVCVAVFVNLSFSSFVERSVRCVRVLL
jgi:hypothetical protein